MTHWILIADRSHARIVEPNAPAFDGLREVKEFTHPEGRLQHHEVVTDQQGRFRETAGGSHAGQPETDFAHETAETFAGELTEYLEKNRQANRFSELSIVASPMFLGVLRGKFPAPLSQIVKHEIDKNYTSLDIRELYDRLEEIL
ncbi:MAG: hypothetical protein Tsb009_15200 [Planctomycetaceae bacterium]